MATTATPLVAPAPPTPATTMMGPSSDITEEAPLDELSIRLREEALQAMEDEPELTTLLQHTVLAPGVRTFEDAVACAITYRMLGRPCHLIAAGTTMQDESPKGEYGMFCPNSLRGILHDAFTSSTIRENGHTMAEAVRLDALAVCDRDPAVDSVLEVVLFLKGFAALVTHRAAYYKWHTAKKKSLTALWLQSQASAVFGLDIHPAATMGAGILLDHGTGIVIGETATVGDGCTLLHGVTLGGTGKQEGDRHPKVGADVLIGANASLLGNISIGNGAKIGAGSIVLGHIPSGATAVGAPAKIIGRAKEAKPGSTMDETLQQVSHLHKSESSSTVATTASMTATGSTASSGSDEFMDILEEDGNVSPDDDEDNEEEEANNPTDAAAGASSTPKDIVVDESQKQQQHNHQHHHDHPPKNISHPKKKNSNSTKTNCCCPFRDYVKAALSAPQGTITLCTLRRLLQPEGCTVPQIGEVLFQLDTKNVGYVKSHVFFGPAGREAIVQKTMLSPERVTVIMAEFELQWKAERALLKDMKRSVTPEISSSSLHAKSADAVGFGKFPVESGDKRKSG